MTLCYSKETYETISCLTFCWIRFGLAREWVFPTIDIGSGRGKFIFVYDGDLDPTAAKKLQHYFVIVVSFHKFKDFLQEDRIIDGS